MGTAVNMIIIEDDEDDVRVSAPHSSTELSTSNSRPLHIPVLDDNDLELRLGLSEDVPVGRRTRLEPPVCLSLLPGLETSLLFNHTIDLTSVNDSNDGCNSNAAKRKRYAPPPGGSPELKLTCAICMDTMEEETSTICGHIFCRKCIVEAIRKQKKCPTCRQRLVNSEIHRIYL